MAAKMATMFGDVTDLQQRPPIKYTSSCWEKIKGFPLKEKSFRNTAMYQKFKGGGGCSINPPPLYHGGGMTLRVCPRVNASFHCSEKVIIFNEWKSRSLRWNRRSLLRIMTYCSTSVTTIITCTAGSKTMERCIKSDNALALYPSAPLLCKKALGSDTILYVLHCIFT